MQYIPQSTQLPETQPLLKLTPLSQPLLNLTPIQLNPHSI